MSVRCYIIIFGTILMLTNCISINQNKSIRKGSPEWHRIYKDRLAKYPLPKIQIIYNDNTLGWLYGSGKKMTDVEFMDYVNKYVNENKKDCEIKFIYGIDLFCHKTVKLAVLHFDGK